VASWGDIGGVVNTLRELDVSAIEEECLRPLTIGCVGDLPRCAELAAMLRGGPAQRFAAGGADPLFSLHPLSADLLAQSGRADLIVVALEGRFPPQGANREALSRLFALPVPQLVVVFGSSGAESLASLPGHMRALALPDPAAPEAQELLAMALVERLPRELCQAAARLLPGLRAAVAAQLTQTTALANASYALASSLPQQIPLLSLPFAAADILVLTKNQALMVYRIALAHGAPADFQAHLREILPVIGGAYVWRQIARTLVGLIPGWGVVPKISVAYAGTYTTGVIATRWYTDGDVLRGDQLRQLGQEALERARSIASDLAATTRERGAAAGGRASDLLRRARKALPGGKNKE
jgi:uncharacterized protein (DUF697 family)